MFILRVTDDWKEYRVLVFLRAKYETDYDKKMKKGFPNVV